MSTEDEEEKLIYEAMLNHFKSCRVEISHAITHTFPFLHGLRDRGLITDRMFQDAEESWRKRVPVKYVVYDVLEKLEKFDGTGFQAVFNEVNLQEYPKLVPIHNRFEIELNRMLRFQNNVRGHIEENSRIQLPLEQVIHSEESEALTHEDQPPEVSTSTAGGEPVINSEESEALTHEDEPPEASTSTAGGEPVIHSEESEALTHEDQPPEASTSTAGGEPGQRRRCNNKQRNLQGAKKGTRRVNSDPLKRGRKRGQRIPRNITEKFKGPELPVECGPMEGILYKNLLQQGSGQKCIQGKDGRYLALREFEIEGGYVTSNNWKQSVRCLGWPLKFLIQKGFLQNPPRSRRKMTIA